MAKLEDRKWERREFSSSRCSFIYIFCLILLAVLMLTAVEAELDTGKTPETPKPQEVRDAHRELMEKYGFQERDENADTEQDREYTYLEPEDTVEKQDNRNGISFIDWLKGLSLPGIIIILVILVILIYLMFRGVPGFFRRETVSPKEKEAGILHEDEYEDDRSSDEGYRQALQWAKKGQYGKALIILHKSSVKKLQEYYWIPQGKNLTNNDIRRLLQDEATGPGIRTPFSQLATAAERAAFKQENPAADTYTQLSNLYESVFVNLQSRGRY